MKKKNKVLITGVTGQIGSYLADLCLEKGMKVFGMARRCSQPRMDNLHIASGFSNFKIVEGDLQDQGSLDRLVRRIGPDFVVNCAAQSFVAESWNTPVLTGDITGLGVVRVLEAIRVHAPRCIFVQMSSSEMFGDVVEEPQNEQTPFNIRSPYGAAKLYAHWITSNYRDSYGIKARCAICFNNESSRRGIEFVTQKIVTHLAEVGFGKRKIVQLGNMDAKRDWTHTQDIVRALYLIMTAEKNDTYVVGSGEHHTVKEFFTLAHKHVKKELAPYAALFEKKFSMPPAGDCFEVCEKFFRPADVNTLLADPSKIRKRLGWKPEITFEGMIAEMAFGAVNKVFSRLYE